jgi:quinol monooxygenase YgiN
MAGILPPNYSFKGNNISTNVIITFKSTPEKLAEFGKLLSQAKLELPKVNGCEAFRVFNDVSDPCTFTLVETWTSEADHKANMEKMVASGLWSHLATHLACDPTSGYYTEL